MGCYGPFVTEVHVDKVSATNYLRTKCESSNWLTWSLGRITVTSETSERFPVRTSSASIPKPIGQTRFLRCEVRRLHGYANGLVLWGCES